MGETVTVTYEVFRYDPDDSTDAPNGAFESFEVIIEPDQSVLMGLNYIKDELDATLSYRWSCGMAVCGSCGMMVNGDPKLSCKTFIKDLLPGPIRVEPLTNFPVIRDLVIYQDDFMDKMTSVKPWMIREKHKDPKDGEYLQTPGELDRYKQFSMCINCMICYSGCPVVGMEEDFIGPAALALGHRYNMDSREDGQAERREIMFSHDGIWHCTFVGECSVVCPKHVDPAAAIQQAKLDATKDWFQSLLKMGRS